MSPIDSKSKSDNPSLGLQSWGPLVPASDCKGCLATLASVQIGAGIALWPWRKSWYKVSTFRRLVLKPVMFIFCSYAIFTGGIEFARMGLSYDPWVEDARFARTEAVETARMMGSKVNLNSWWSPKAWRFKWFGPQDYEPVPYTEWRRRVQNYLNRAEEAKSQWDDMSIIQKGLAEANQMRAATILGRIQRGQFPEPEVPVEELEVLSMLPDFDDEDETYHDLDIENADLWDFFQETRGFNMLVLPRSTPAFLPGVRVSDPDRLQSQNVNYLPIPQSIKTVLR